MDLRTNNWFHVIRFSNFPLKQKQTLVDCIRYFQTFQTDHKCTAITVINTHMHTCDKPIPTLTVVNWNGFCFFPFCFLYFWQSLVLVLDPCPWGSVLAVLALLGSVLVLGGSVLAVLALLGSVLVLVLIFGVSHCPCSWGPVLVNITNNWNIIELQIFHKAVCNKIWLILLHAEGITVS